MQVNIELTGTTQLVMHNAQLADPLNEWSKRIATLSGKRKKTEEDHEAIAKLELGGSLYVDSHGTIVMPAANIKRTIQQGAKLRKLGKAVERALLPAAPEFPLVYKGPQDAKGLSEDLNFRFRTSVKVGQSRVQRTRPRFQQWAVRSTFELLTDLLDMDDLQAVCEMAGLVEGLGDHRTLGSGRFRAKVTKA